MEKENEETRAKSPVRVLEVDIPTVALRQALLGVDAERCRVVFIDMLPVEPPAQLVAVLPHGLVVAMETPTTFNYEKVLIPWDRIAYITTTPC